MLQSTSYLSTIFKKNFGSSIIDYINGLRIEKAKQLICKGELPFKDIAEEVGVGNIYYLSTLFKKYTNMTMGQYANMFLKRVKG